ncbi:unnamed protein product [Soboliphyme baturini]|uniref:C-type lectin domain-containing protein n=1 Tax=Soboliphyme baturini TaxID=241478 RepID=A0A183J0Y4_9BILA|nr:unnamed protein product [Soboliphyme baturini]
MNREELILYPHAVVKKKPFIARKDYLPPPNVHRGPATPPARQRGFPHHNAPTAALPSKDVLVNRNASFYEASNYCRRLGSHLLYVHDQRTLDKVLGLLPTKSATWIGLKQAGTSEHRRGDYHEPKRGKTTFLNVNYWFLRAIDCVTLTKVQSLFKRYELRLHHCGGKHPFVCTTNPDLAKSTNRRYQEIDSYLESIKSSVEEVERNDGDYYFESDVEN